jgi:hypothetical protein
MVSCRMKRITCFAGFVRRSGISVTAFTIFVKNDQRQLLNNKKFPIMDGEFFIGEAYYFDKGSCIKKVLPGKLTSSCPELSTQMLPFKARMIPEAIARPSPAPPPL